MPLATAWWSLALYRHRAAMMELVTLHEIEAMCRSLLSNAAARDWAASRAAPEVPTVEYRTGFAAGHEAGEVAALALVVSMLSGESATALVDEARSRAAVDAAFPFELHFEGLAEDVA